MAVTMLGGGRIKKTGSVYLARAPDRKYCIKIEYVML